MTKNVIMNAVIMIVAVVCVLTGCGSSSPQTTKEEISPVVAPQMVSYEPVGYKEVVYVGTSYVGIDVYYLVDMNNGVVYLGAEHHGSSRYDHGFSVTVMLNPDGTPVTADQIGLELPTE